MVSTQDSEENEVFRLAESWDASSILAGTFDPNMSLKGSSDFGATEA